MLLFIFVTHSKLSVSWPALSRLSAAARTVFADKGLLDPMQLVLPPFTAAVIRVYDEAGNVIEPTSTRASGSTGAQKSSIGNGQMLNNPGCFDS